jgi:uncharacterized protein (DUF1697 family)
MAGRHPTWVALLRGINVGGRTLPMNELVARFEEAGAHDVSTYIQSGNVIFTASARVTSRIQWVVAAGIQKRHGFASPVIVRSALELRGAVSVNPFLRAGESPDCLHVAFLSDVPDRDRIAALEPNRSPGDRFAVSGREVYLHCPNGYGQTKLTNQWFDSRLGTVSTVRNWRTVLKLLELAGG